MALIAYPSTDSPILTSSFTALNSGALQEKASTLAAINIIAIAIIGSAAPDHTQELTSDNEPDFVNQLSQARVRLIENMFAWNKGKNLLAKIYLVFLKIYLTYIAANNFNFLLQYVPNTVFRVAAENGYSNILATVVEDPIRLNNLPKKSIETAFNTAVANNHIAVVELLFKKVNIPQQLTSFDLRTNFEKIIENNFSEIFQMFIENSDIMKIMSDHYIELFGNADNGNYHIHRAMQVAAAKGHSKIIEILITNPATAAKITNREVHVGLLEAAKSNHMEAVEILLNNADTLQKLTTGTIYDLGSVLGQAAENGYTDLARRLVEDPVIAATMENYSITEALLRAAGSKHMEIIEILLQDTDTLQKLTAGHNLGYTLGQAAENGYTDLARRLITHPTVAAKIIGFEIQSCLVSAAKSNHMETVEILLQDTDTLQKLIEYIKEHVLQDNILYTATENGCVELVRRLLATPEIFEAIFTASLNSHMLQNVFTVTTNVAVAENQAEILAILYSYPRILHRLGTLWIIKAFEYAAENGHAPILDRIIQDEQTLILLLQLHMRSLETAFQSAVKNNHREVVQLFLGRPDIMKALSKQSLLSAIYSAGENNRTEIFQLFCDNKTLEQLSKNIDIDRLKQICDSNAEIKRILVASLTANKNYYLMFCLSEYFADADIQSLIDGLDNDAEALLDFPFSRLNPVNKKYFLERHPELELLTQYEFDAKKITAANNQLEELEGVQIEELLALARKAGIANEENDKKLNDFIQHIHQRDPIVGLPNRETRPVEFEQAYKELELKLKHIIKHLKRLDDQETTEQNLKLIIEASTQCATAWQEQTIQTLTTLQGTPVGETETVISLRNIRADLLSSALSAHFGSDLLEDIEDVHVQSAVNQIKDRLGVAHYSAQDGVSRVGEERIQLIVGEVLSLYTPAYIIKEFLKALKPNRKLHEELKAYFEAHPETPATFTHERMSAEQIQTVKTTLAYDDEDIKNPENKDMLYQSTLYNPNGSLIVGIERVFTMLSQEEFLIALQKEEVV